MRTAKGTYELPYAKLEIAPSGTDRITRAYVDEELGREAVTYELESGREGTFHVDPVLDSNRDPGYLADLLLYRLTVAAAERVESSGLGIRQLARRSRSYASRSMEMVLVAMKCGYMHACGMSSGGIQARERDRSRGRHGRRVSGSEGRLVGERSPGRAAALDGGRSGRRVASPARRPSAGPSGRCSLEPWLDLRQRHSSPSPRCSGLEAELEPGDGVPSAGAGIGESRPRSAACGNEIHERPGHTVCGRTRLASVPSAKSPRPPRLADRETFSAREDAG